MGIGNKQLESLLRLGLRVKEEASALAGGFAEALNEAVNDHKLHKSAYSHVLKLTKMGIDKREPFLRAVEDYSAKARATGLWEEHAGDIVDMAEEPTEFGDDDEVASAVAQSNVQAIREGIGQLDEENEIRPDGTVKRRGRPKGFDRERNKLGI